MDVISYLFLYFFVVLICKIFLDAATKVTVTDPEANNVAWFKAVYKHIPYAFAQALALWPEGRAARNKAAEAEQVEAEQAKLNAFKAQEVKEKAANFFHSSYIAHCFSCKCTLNSSVDNRCWWCNWLKCKCGACKCNYKGY